MICIDLLSVLVMLLIVLKDFGLWCMQVFFVGIWVDVDDGVMCDVIDFVIGCKIGIVFGMGVVEMCCVIDVVQVV